MAQLSLLSQAIKAFPEPIWVPQAGPQSLAYLSEADELFFGGAVGGGKSWLMLGLALTAHVRSLLLRTEATQLEELKTSLTLLQRPGDTWRGLGHGGTFTTADGRTLELNGCDSFDTADRKFRGRGHDLKLFDELPLFPRRVYTTLVGWTRTAIPGQRYRIVGAGNPPITPEQEWVLDYWSPWLRDKTALPGELIYYAAVGKNMDGLREVVRVEGPKPIHIRGEKYPIIPFSRTFIPSTLEDNPIYEATGYRRVLQNLDDPRLRAQLESGDMTVGLVDHPDQIIPSAWVDASFRRWKPREPNDPRELSVMAIDPARGGKDRFTITKRYEDWVAPIIEIPGSRVPEGKQGAVAVLLELERVAAVLIVDIIGTAGGDLFGSVRAYAPSISIWAFNGSSRSDYRDATGKLKMRNARTEAYWRLREALNPNQEKPLALPPNPLLRAELLAHRGKLFIDGFGVEGKDEIIKRIGRSPDLADSLSMSMMDSVALGGWVSDVSQQAREIVEFMGSALPKNPIAYEDERYWNSHTEGKPPETAFDWGA